MATTYSPSILISPATESSSSITFETYFGLDISKRVINITGSSGTGTIATLTFNDTGSINTFNPGTNYTIVGHVPTNYNGNYTAIMPSTGMSSTQVLLGSNPGTGPMTTAGTIILPFRSTGNYRYDLAFQVGDDSSGSVVYGNFYYIQQWFNDIVIDPTLSVYR
jgi:hypothetical protein